MQLKEIRNIFHKELDSIYPKEEVDSFFYMLVEHYLGLERFVLAMQPNLTITKEEEQPIFEALSELKLERPIQYIIGKAHFMEMDFKVDKNVLIPRPETEELVRWILSEVPNTKHEVQNTRYKIQGAKLEAENRIGKNKKNGKGTTGPLRDLKILDIGTGSGCIAISLAKNLPDAKVSALDVSEKALEIARENALAHKVEITFAQADILKLKKLDPKFDIIVSNPPYVRELEKDNIGNNVKNYEPGSALFVSNEDPLVFYQKIVFFAKENLNQGGALFFEVNQYLAKETKQLLEDQNFTDIELRKDMNGNYRMLKGRVI